MPEITTEELIKALEAVKLITNFYTPEDELNADPAWDLDSDAVGTLSDMYHEAEFIIISADNLIKRFPALNREELDISEEGNVLVYLSNDSSLWHINTNMLYYIMDLAQGEKLPPYYPRKIKELLNLD